MNLYVTSESYYRVKTRFTNINSFALIDVNSIIKDLNLDLSKIFNKFIVQDEIKKMLAAYSKNKKYKGIVYISPEINFDVISNIKKLIYDNKEYNEYISDVVLLDDYDSPKLEKYYNLVNEVMFFSTFKRIKIIECKIIDKIKRNE